MNLYVNPWPTFNQSNIFCVVLGFSIFLCINSSSFLSIWFCMEFGLLAFLPIMMGSKSLNEIEACMKYFLIQCVSSSIFLYCCSVSLSFDAMSLYTFFLLMVSILLKLGAAPFYIWFPSISSCISWKNFFILSVLQKIIPLYILMSLNVSSVFMIFLSFLSTLVGTMGSLNQFCLKKLMAYSSISHLGWLMISSKLSWLTFLFYFFFYFFVMLEMVFFFSFLNLSYLSDLVSNKSLSLFTIFASLKFFSLAGLPPFLGFYPKSSVIYMMLKSKMLWFASYMSVVGLFSIFVYTRVLLSSLIMSLGALKFFKVSFWVSGFNNSWFLISEVFTFLLIFMFFGFWMFL